MNQALLLVIGVAVAFLGWIALRTGGFAAAVVACSCGLAAAAFFIVVTVLTLAPGEDSTVWNWVPEAALACGLVGAAAAVLGLRRFLRAPGASGHRLGSRSRPRGG